MGDFKRRTDAEIYQVGDYFQGANRYYDRNYEVTVVKLFSGDCYVSTSPHEMIVTILGSCISACIHDPAAKISGMNHFLLPGDPAAHATTIDASTRYGAFAMEKLINGMISVGARKDRMQVKVFGGGDVTAHSGMIGSRNAAFVQDFLTRERLTILSSDLGGTTPRRIHFDTGTGKVLLRTLHRQEDMRVVTMERAYQEAINKNLIGGDVDLF